MSQAAKICGLISLLINISNLSSAQYSITGTATQTIDFTGFSGSGFDSGPSSGYLDSDDWVVDFGDDGQDFSFGATETSGPYAGGNNSNGYYAGAAITIFAQTATANQPSLQWRASTTVDDAVILRIQNNTGSTVSALQIAFDVYDRVSNTPTNAEFEFYYSDDNVTYAENTDLGNAYPTGTTTNFLEAPLNFSDKITGLSIANGGYYYLKWVLKASGATASMQFGIALDDISLTATVVPGDGEGSLVAGSTNFGDFSSLSVSSPGEDVFDFTITDDAFVDDGFATLFDQLTIHAGASDGIDDWSDVIAGAMLTDGSAYTTTATAIGTSSITFENIGTSSTALGNIADNGSETFTLSIWLNTSISEDIDGDLFHFTLSEDDFNFDGATSTLSADQTVESNTAYNDITVTATQWGFRDTPSTVGLLQDFSLTVAATDVYGNVDLDDNTSTFILSRGSTGSNNLTENGASYEILSAKTVTNGRYSYTDLRYDVAESFDIDADDSGGPYFSSTSTTSVIAAALSFQTNGSGEWIGASVWEYWNGSAWISDGTDPSSTDGAINILSGHTITINSNPVTADQITIENGGQLTLSSGGSTNILTLADGSGDDLIIESGGQLNVTSYNAGAPVFTGTMRVEAGGIVYSNVNRTTVVGAQTYYETDAIYQHDVGDLTYAFTYFPNAGSTDYPIFEYMGAASTSSSAFTINGILRSSFSGGTSFAANNIVIRNGISGDEDVTITNGDAFTGDVVFFEGAGAIDLDGDNFSFANEVQLLSDKEIFNGTMSFGSGSTLDLDSYSLNDGSNDNLTLDISSGTSIICNATSGLSTGLAAGVTPAVGSAVNYSFEGSAAQTANFGGLGITEANDLTLNNSNGLTLNSDLTISGTVNLSNGILTTASSGSGLLTLNGGTISGYSSARFINGPLQKATFTGSFEFPVGDGTDYRPVVLEPASSSTFTVVHTTGTPTDNSNVTSPITEIITSRYWDITRDAGSGTCDMVLYFDTSTDGLSASTDLRITNYSSSWTETNASPTVNADNIESTGISGFGSFTIGTTAVSLPVELLTFKGQTIGDYIHLSWETASELNNDRFEIERSQDGVHFAKIGTIEGHGTVNSIKNYGFSDGSPHVGLNYYRLNQVDYDGTSHLHPIISVRYDGDLTEQLKVYPNPASEQSIQVVLSHAHQNELVTYSIVNLQGQEILVQQALASSDSQFKKELSMDSLLPGTYILNVIQSGTSHKMVFVRK